MDTQEYHQQITLDDIKIADFHKSSHLKILKEWASYQNLDILITEEDLPKIGYISFYGFIPICAGFLRKCEKNIGIFDSLIADPRVRGEIRNLGIEKVISEILNVAKKEGINDILAFTASACVMERARKFQFQEKSNYRILSLNLH